MRRGRVGVITLAEACRRAWLFSRATFGREALVELSKEFPTHWFITVRVPLSEKSCPQFMICTTVVDKHKGHLYFPTSRSLAPIRWNEFPANRSLFLETTAQEFRELERLCPPTDKPFRPLSLDPAWLTATVRNLARVIDEERRLPSGLFDNQRMAVLADALEDAGCVDAALLDHCRQPREHVRGCWVIDLLLGKG